jgi:Icc-related predicted phosphoesterase
MQRCLLVADLHGDLGRYRRLFHLVGEEAPDAVFMGGDLLPSAFGAGPALDEAQAGFIDRVLGPGLARVRETLGSREPRVFLIPGNDDCRAATTLLEAGAGDLWEYAHGRKIAFGDLTVYGYAYVPPTPFRLKDWERYDVSRYVDPGCTAPDEGLHTTAPDEDDLKWGTIREDLERLAGSADLARALFLFHAPPYDTPLDRAALDGRRIDHVPLDVHVGSIAIRRFIEQRQPLITLHGHIHEAARLSGTWRTSLGRTHCLSAAHDGAQLAVVRFDPSHPEGAERELLTPM